MDWNADLYENKHDFIAEYGKSLLAYVPETPEQSILDLGCGTGTLTHALLEKSSSVIGLDSSTDMIKKARRLCPGMTGLTWCSPTRRSIGYRIRNHC